MFSHLFMWRKQMAKSRCRMHFAIWKQSFSCNFISRQASFQVSVEITNSTHGKICKLFFPFNDISLLKAHLLALPWIWSSERSYSMPVWQVSGSSNNICLRTVYFFPSHLFNSLAIPRLQALLGNCTWQLIPPYGIKK